MQEKAKNDQKRLETQNSSPQISISRPKQVRRMNLFTRMWNRYLLLIFLIIWFLIATTTFIGSVLLIILLLFSIYNIYTLQIAIKSTNWPSTIGTVSSHHVKKVSSGGGEYDPVIWVGYVVLSYFVSGKEYLKDNVRTTVWGPTVKGRHRDRKIKEKTMAETLRVYPVGSEFAKPIFYNPTRPLQSVMESGIESWSARFVSSIFALILYPLAMLFSLPMVEIRDSFSIIPNNLDALFGIVYNILIIVVSILVFLSFFQVYFGWKGRKVPDEKQMTNEDWTDLFG